MDNIFIVREDGTATSRVGELVNAQFEGQEALKRAWKRMFPGRDMPATLPSASVEQVREAVGAS